MEQKYTCPFFIFTILDVYARPLAKRVHVVISVTRIARSFEYSRAYAVLPSRAGACEEIKALQHVFPEVGRKIYRRRTLYPSRNFGAKRRRESRFASDSGLSYRIYLIIISSYS